MSRAYVDPIAHAWRCCNPQTPLPSALEKRGAEFGAGAADQARRETGTGESGGAEMSLLYLLRPLRFASYSL